MQRRLGSNKHHCRGMLEVRISRASTQWHREGGGYVGIYYLDDGTIIIHPALVVPQLRSLDEEIGNVRGKKSFIKGHVTIYAAPATLEDRTQEWQMEEMRRLSTVNFAGDKVISLGVAMGRPEQRADHFRTKVQAVQGMYDEVQYIGHSATENV